MPTPSTTPKAPKASLCVAIFLAVCLVVGLFNWLTASPAPVTLHGEEASTIAPRLLTPTPSPETAVTPEATPSPMPSLSPTPSIAAASPTLSPTPTPASTASPAPEITGTWVLNTSTKRFHDPGCKSVPTIKEKNRGEFTGPREDLIEQGYKPCGNCKP